MHRTEWWEYKYSTVKTYLEHLIKVLTEVLYKVHVRNAREHKVSRLLGKGHFGLRQPCPVERIYMHRDLKNIYYFTW